jgi:drug/metabolite transporter (DMT)-like permease
MFLAGSCYGIVVPLVRAAYGAGFSTVEVMATQYLLAALLLSSIVALFSRRRIKLLDVVKLLGVGAVAAGVSFSYFQALSLLPSATALTLLFQFVWMGMLVQALRERHLPRLGAFGAMLLVMVGALGATGVVEEGFSPASLPPAGLFFGMLSALFYTAFLVLSSKVATTLPAVNRTMITAVGSLLLTFLLDPGALLATGLSAQSMLVSSLPLSLALGLIGICLPVFLIALSAPKLPSGLTTVMASSELPSGVLCAVLFCGDPLPLSVGMGIIIVIGGIVLSEWESLRAAARQ